MEAWNAYLARGVYEPLFGPTDVESIAQFNENMYPKGVNADFMNDGTKATVEITDKFKPLFEGEQRDISLSREEIIQTMRNYGLRAGATFLDVGAGTGLFLSSVSAIIGDAGKLYATEVSDAFTEHLTALAKEKALQNVTIELVGAQPNEFKSVPDGTVDLAIICDVYHHFEYPKTTMRAIRKALKPQGGKVMVLDFIRDPVIHTGHPYPWILNHVRADQNKFRREIMSAGFKLVDSPVIAGLRENYVMVFEVDSPQNIYA